MKLNFILILMVSLAALVFVSGCMQYGEQRPQVTQPEQPAPTETVLLVQGNIIEITSSGFNPNVLTINASDTVTFINRDNINHWPASDPHPGHFLYPETGGCINSKFDACRGLPKGESFSFTFNLTGTWKYHDHLNSGLTGTIVVK